jgi:hypothetical protein
MDTHIPAQATFVGMLAVVLLVAALVVAVLLVAVATRSGSAVDVPDTPPAEGQAAEPVPGV